MLFLYNFSIRLYRLAIGLSSPFNKKASLWVQGRRDIFDRISSSLQPGETRVWFHCASLGEFEQGRPLIEAYRRKYPDRKIVLTFFSPSGYAIRKSYSGADYVFYLPLDTPENARRFLDLVQPEKIFFIKYEFWYHYIHEAYTRSIPCFLVSATFRENQLFFKSYGGFYRDILRCFSYIFVQNERSRELLSGIGLENAAIGGDTRFDRVYEVAQKTVKIPVAEQFCQGKKTMVAGSTWDKDEELLKAFLADQTGLRLIMAPHEIGSDKMEAMERSWNNLTGGRAILYSKASAVDALDEYSVLLIDNIGMLSSLYAYADFAYIGGGFGKGIHNILEAATFGCPVFFGPNYGKFIEATELIALGGAFATASAEQLRAHTELLLSDPAEYSRIEGINKDYVREKTGATAFILDTLEKL